MLIALLGTPDGYDEAHRAFQTGWAACAVVALLAVIPAVRMTPRHTEDPVSGPLVGAAA